jgi:hypothetical protein
VVNFYRRVHRDRAQRTGQVKKLGRLRIKKGKAKLLVTGSNLICPFGGYMFVEKTEIGLFAPSGLPVNRPAGLEKYTFPSPQGLPNAIKLRWN